MTITAPTVQEAILSAPELIQEARGWLIDAYSLDPDEFTASDSRVLQLVGMTYDGGLPEFYSNSQTLISAN
jgi:hypothetical protein